MTDLPEPDASGPPELADTFRQITENQGYISNLMHALTLAPAGLRHFVDLDHYCRYGTHLTARQRSLAILVAQRDVHYGWMHQTPLARLAGLTAEQIELIREGRTPRDLEPEDRALCNYAFEVTACRRVPPRVQEAMEQLFQPKQIIDAALLTTYFMAAAALTLALDVEPEPAETLQLELEWHRNRPAG